MIKGKALTKEQEEAKQQCLRDCAKLKEDPTITEDEVAKLYVLYKKALADSLFRKYLILCMLTYARAVNSNNLEDYMTEYVDMHIKYAKKDD